MTYFVICFLGGPHLHINLNTRFTVPFLIFVCLEKMSVAPAKKLTKSAPAEHPSYIEMITNAISSLKERSGSSRQAIAKFIKSNYKGISDESLKIHLKLALKRGVASGRLLQPKGQGGSGSFKVAKVEKKPNKKAAPKKPDARPKKAITPKKKPEAKKPAAKKPAANKANIPAAKKPAKSPKKATAKKAAKKPVKKPAAKEPAAKKPAKKTATKKTAAKK